MHLKLIIILLNIFLLIFTGIAFAQEQSPGEVKIRRNPFLPQLPVKEAPKPEPRVNPTPPPPPVVKNPRSVQPTVKAPSRMPTLSVSSIVWDSDRPQAIINGIIKDLGDVIDGVKIISIEKEGVTVIYKEKNILLKAN